MRKTLNRISRTWILVFGPLVFFTACEKDSTDEIIAQEKFDVPSIADAQRYFEQSGNGTGNLASRTAPTSFTDWEVSKAKTYKQTEQLNVDILYTPIYINTQRTDVKVFLASTEHNGIVDARKVYVLYKSNDIGNGLSAYVFVFNLGGHMELAYNFENGQEVPFPQQGVSTNRSDCGGYDSGMSDAEFEEWINDCYPNSIAEVVINVPTTSDTPSGGNQPVFDMPTWVPINLPPLDPGYNSGGSGGSGGLWYVPNTVTATPLSITIALDVPLHSEVSDWLAQQLQNNQETLEAIAAYLNANRVRSNTHNNSTMTNDGADGIFQYQYPEISDEAVGFVLDLISFLMVNPNVNIELGSMNNDEISSLEEFLENISSYPDPHCSSFEYAKPPNLNIRACAVTNFTETFYAYGEQDGQLGTISATAHYPIVFFIMPTWMTNGQAATLTAQAVKEAFANVRHWYYINFDATDDEILSYLDDQLIYQMGLYGGTKTDMPPFTIPSPAPYATSLFGTGNCN